ncbi:MAG: universal stress protein [Bacteroidota bacterium]
MINQILIPTDFSPASWEATKLGVEIAKLRNATLSLLHIIPTVSRYSDEKKQLQLPDRISTIKKKMDEICLNLDTTNSILMQTHVLPGNVENTMSRFVQENIYDLVILGINSNGENNEIGSHTKHLIESCGIPVLLVPNKRQASEAIAV